MIALAVDVAALALLVQIFATLERRGRSDLVVALILTALALQVVLYPIDARVPGGPFRPARLRLPEILIVGAVVARVLVRGLPGRITTPAVAWVIFFSWYGFEAIHGQLLHHRTETLLFHARAIIYIGGAMVIAAGTSPSQLARSRWVRSWAWVAGVVAAAVAALSLSGRVVPQVGPFVQTEFGRIAGDTASFACGIGAVLLAIALARDRVRPGLTVSASVLVLLPVLSTQRAALVGLGATVAVLAVAFVSRSWNHQMALTRTSAMILLMGAASVVLAMSLVQVHGGQSFLPAQLYEQTFLTASDQESAEARLLKWDEGRQQFAESPAFGLGLGKTVRSFHPGIGSTGAFRTVDVYDSVPFDLSVRTGAVGLVLFVIAVTTSLWAGFQTWRSHPVPHVAAVALGATAATTGLLAKGLVESVLDKVVLACLLGLALGLIHAAAADRPRRSGDQPTIVTRARSSSWN